MHLHPLLRLLGEIELVLREEQAAALALDVQPVRPRLGAAERQPQERERVGGLSEEKPLPLRRAAAAAAAATTRLPSTALLSSVARLAARFAARLAARRVALVACYRLEDALHQREKRRLRLLELCVLPLPKRHLDALLHRLGRARLAQRRVSSSGFHRATTRATRLASTARRCRYCC